MQEVSFLKTLNTAQRAAVEHFEGPILVLAGAGSGKTRVLTHRVAHLVIKHSIRPGSILAVTFTNKATQEMKERLAALLGDAAKTLWVSTFHAMCVRILRRHADRLDYTTSFTIYDDADSKQVIKRLLADMQLDVKKYPINRFRHVIDQAKNQNISAEEYAKNVKGHEASINAEVYDRYQKELRLADAMDFGDLLVNTLKLFKKNTDVLRLYQDMLSFVLVDEFQDTNTIQYDLIKLLSAPQNNLLVVGDDDQSIYAFRGATVANILNFEKDFPQAKTVTLDQNYRSTQSILEVAHHVIARNTKRKKKKLWTDAPPGAPIYSFVGEEESDEAAFVARQIIDLQKNGKSLDSIAIFYRTNAQSRALEEALMDRGIAYKIFGGLKFYDRKEIKDILAYLRMLVSDTDNQAFIRTLNNPTRGIGTKAFQDIVILAKESDQSLWQAACQYAADNKKVAGYVILIEEFRELLGQKSLGELIGIILERSGYMARLKDADPATLSRKENLKELQAIALSMELVERDGDKVLQAFLDRVALSSSADLPQDEHESEQTGSVSLMTLHLAKGLEYANVFFTGLEEGLLPHSRSMQSPADIEEERRLCYVGITRAMERLYLTRARKRGMFSAGGESPGLQGRFREPSRFIFDVPEEYVESLGGDFRNAVTYDLNGSDDYAFEPEESFTTWQSRKKDKKSRSIKEKLAFASNLIASADSLIGSGQARAQANLADIMPGVEVIHPTFGHGVVEALYPASSGEPGKSKVEITFTEDSQTKKLILGRARLSLA